MMSFGALTGCGPGDESAAGGNGGTGGQGVTTSSTSSTTTSTQAGGAGGTGGSGATGGEGGAGGSGGSGAMGGAGGAGGSGATGGEGGAGGGAVCGDGDVEGAESCDDGNVTAGDGCSAACEEERGFDCHGEPSVCEQPSCEGVSTWSDPTNVFPACFMYVVAESFDANNCEFYVDVFGRGSFSAGGASGKWLEAEMRIGAPEGELQVAGMFTRYLDAGGTQQTAWSLSSETAPGVWRTGFTWERTGLGPNSFSYTVVDFAFFIDVASAGGAVIRLWVSGGGANYTVAQTYAVPGSTVSMGSSSIEYASDQAPLFDQKHACAP